MAEELDKVEIQIVLDDGSVQKGFVNVKKQAAKTGKTLEDKLGGGFKKLGTKLAVLGGAVAAAFAGRAIIEAAKQQEEAVNQLNTSLRLAGEFSEESSNQIQEFASQLQRTTTIGDETTLQMFAMARNLTKTNEEAQKLTEAAVELSAATGMSLDSAVKNLGKTFAGMTGELGESLPQLRGLSKEALQSGAALDFVLDRFGGAAAAKTKTFGGAMEQMSNNFGDLLESIGFVAIKSPALIAVINHISEAFADLGSSLMDAAPADALKGILDNMVTFAAGVNSFVIMPIEKAVRGLNFLFQGVRLLIAKIFNTEDMKAATDGFNEALLNIGSEEVTDAISNNLVNLKDKIKNAVKGAEKPIIDTAKKTTDAISNVLVSAETKLAMIRGGLSKGFQSMGTALVNGENAFEAFGKSILSSFGDFLIKMGESAIAIGVTAEGVKASISTLNGGAAIAAGAALIALGSAFKAIGAPATSSGGGVAGASAEATEESTEALDLEDDSGVSARPKLGTQVTLNIQGNVLDRRETGLELVDVINEYFDNQGGTLVGVN